MSHSVLRAPKTVVRYEPDRPGYASSISVALGEPARSVISYRIQIECRFSGGLARLGSILTAPPLGRRRAGRVVAIANCPGVLEWLISATPIRPYDGGRVGGTLKVEGCQYPSPPGVMALDGAILESGGEGAGIYNHASGLNPVTPFTVAVPTGAAVTEISAQAKGGGDATIAVIWPLSSPDVVTVKAGKGFTTRPTGLVGPVSIVFGGNVLTYFVAWREAR